MIKHVFVFEPVNTLEMERWYFRFHSKECLRFFGPWLRRYETYRAYNAPPEADDRFGVRRGRMTELWHNSVADFLEANPNNRPYTSPAAASAPVAQPKPTAITIVPAMPTEDFLGKEPTPEQVHILRWYQVLKYPDGVSFEDGEKWYLEVHSQEAKEQPGLLRYVSHRIMENPPIDTPYIRVTEMWYENFDAWRKAVIDSPPKYTAPSWGGEYPFVDMVSTFLPYKPDIDFLKDNPLIP